MLTIVRIQFLVSGLLILQPHVDSVIGLKPITKSTKGRRSNNLEANDTGRIAGQEIIMNRFSS